MQSEEIFMQRCLDLAIKGFTAVSPNPMVGAVIVHQNKIIGEGYHKEYGSYHAEVNAINRVKDKKLLSQATLYVNLEPCAHFGKTPPCSNLIIEHKIQKVVVGCIDTFSEVAGKGIAKMKEAGIEVITGVLEKESRDLNKRFFTFHEKKRPYIILKWAKSKDGFIAPKNQNASFWMTSSASKKLVHQWRSEETAILVGRVTAEKDNPSLTVRKVKGRNPIRIVIDKDLKLSKNLKLFNDEAKTIILNGSTTKNERSNSYINICFNNLINNILAELTQLNIQSLIVEGGSKILHSFIAKNLWDEARVFTADKTLNEGIKAPKIEGKIITTTSIASDKLELICND